MSNEKTSVCIHCGRPVKLIGLALRPPIACDPDPVPFQVYSASYVMPDGRTVYGSAGDAIVGYVPHDRTCPASP